MTPAAELLREARAALTAAGVDSAEIDARLLFEAATGIGRTALVVEPFQPVGEPDGNVFRGLVERRCRREPLAYILGRREFWSLCFEVGPGVLVPRPDSETLIEAALDAFENRSAALRILDIGVGSGCLLVAALTEFPAAVGIGTDLSESALVWSCRNAHSLGVGERMRLVRGAFAAGQAGPFDLVLCNPPYVATSDLWTLEPELAFEPRAALDGGPDGLEPYRTLIPILPGLLATNGVAILEHGVGQSGSIAALAEDVDLDARARADLSGRDRALILRRRVSAGVDA